MDQNSDLDWSFFLFENAFYDIWLLGWLTSCEMNPWPQDPKQQRDPPFLLITVVLDNPRVVICDFKAFV